MPSSGADGRGEAWVDGNSEVADDHEMRIHDSRSGKSYFSKRRRRLDDARTARSLTFVLQAV